MPVVLSYDAKMAGYCFGDAHPMRPERFALAVDLMRAWGLIAEADPAAQSAQGDASATELSPEPATDDDLLLAHSPRYIAHVIEASVAPERCSGHGLGYGDTPAFPHMHEITSLIVGGTMLALDEVVSGRAQRTFAPAGGLHHAHYDHASGFCVYNDIVVAIERAVRQHEDLRVAYVDIDAHHGDGVEHAFETRADVLTLSVHESGRYLFPGTGRPTDIGRGAGKGYAIDVAMPPDADPACYELVLEAVIEPAMRRFAPDVILLQAGGDTHFGDPLTHIRQTIAGFCDLCSGVLRLADELTEGRIAVTGGGGYQPFSAVPRMWASVMALLLGMPVPERLPQEWVARANETAQQAGWEPMAMDATLSEEVPDIGEERRTTALQATRHSIGMTVTASPLLGERS